MAVMQTASRAGGAPLAHSGAAIILHSNKGHILYLSKLPLVASPTAAIKRLASDGTEEGHAFLLDRVLGASEFPRALCKQSKKPFIFSILLRPKIQPQKASAITPLATVALMRTLRALLPSYHLSVRWPCTIYNGKKPFAAISLCSALHPSDGTFSYMALSFMVALSGGEAKNELARTLSEVFDGVSADLHVRLASRLAKEVYSLYESMERDRSFLDEYRLFSGDVGARVILRNPRLKATVLNVDENGKLVLQKKDGSVIRIASADRIKKILPLKRK